MIGRDRAEMLRADGESAMEGICRRRARAEMLRADSESDDWRMWQNLNDGNREV